MLLLLLLANILGQSSPSGSDLTFISVQICFALPFFHCCLCQPLPLPSLYLSSSPLLFFFSLFVSLFESPSVVNLLSARPFCILGHIVASAWLPLPVAPSAAAPAEPVSQFACALPELFPCISLAFPPPSRLTRLRLSRQASGERLDEPKK